jgi:hypothetical protein
VYETFGITVMSPCCGLAQKLTPMSLSQLFA